jgi:hypothetical protein
VRRAVTFAALATLILAAPATAENPPRLFVLAFKAPPALTFTGKRLAEAVVTQAVKEGVFDVVGPDAVEERLGRRAYLRLVACGGEARCIADADVVLGADLVVGGQLVQRESTYQVRMSQVEVKTGKALARVARVVPIGSRRLFPDVGAASQPLLRGETEGLGSLFVSTSVPRAEVRIDGAAAGYTPLAVRLKPGKHGVEVEKEGYAKPDAQSVEIADGEVSEVGVALTPLPPAGVVQGR